VESEWQCPSSVAALGRPASAALRRRLRLGEGREGPRGPPAHAHAGQAPLRRSALGKVVLCEMLLYVQMPRIRP